MFQKTSFFKHQTNIPIFAFSTKSAPNFTQRKRNSPLDDSKALPVNTARQASIQGGLSHTSVA